VGPSSKPFSEPLPARPNGPEGVGPTPQSDPPRAGGARTGGALARVGAALSIVAGAVLLRLVGGVGFANYDTLYALVWGQQLTRGETPQYGIPIAPTPHPLVEALGVALAPLGPRATEHITVALGFLALSACGWAVYRLGALWFNRPAGVVAALILLTRWPTLSYGVRAYVDLPYLLLVLCALIFETRRPRAGAPVLALLGLAGLLRPEAWVFSGVYWLYLFGPYTTRSRTRWYMPRKVSQDTREEQAVGGSAPGEASAAAGGPPGEREVLRSPGERDAPRTPRELAWLALLAAAAPLIWVASDWLVTGDALWSLTNTRHTAETLHRETGIAKVPEYIPRRIGEILGPAALAVAAVGGVLSLLWLRARALPGAVVGVAAVVVFAAFATVGLPIDTRYAFLAAAILCVFCGAAVCGWICLPRADPRRRWWMLAATLALAALFASAPSQYRTDHRELDELTRQQRIQNELLALVREGAITVRCEPIGVSNHAPIPLLALWLGTPPSEIANLQVQRIARGTYVDPANLEVQTHYILDRNDPHRPVSVPAGFTATRANRSWLIYQHCS
jgi:hypothetical protein